jgi:hypothetical protein
VISQSSEEKRTVTKIIILKKLLPREPKLNWNHKSEITLKKSPIKRKLLEKKNKKQQTENTN